MPSDSRQAHRYTFGPVPSRRLVRSLGIDPVPYKICSYDCIYCQLGRTTDKSIERREYYPVDDIIADCKDSLKDIQPPNYITLSGSGEPSLYSRMDELITGIKTVTNIPVAYLTNGSLLFEEEVLGPALKSDLIIPSLDAGDEETFLKINRPHEKITFKKMVDGLCSLKREYTGPVWLEVFLVDGISTPRRHIEELKVIIDRIAPDRIQLNTAVRGALEDYVRPVSSNTMLQVQQFFGSRCEIIAHDPSKEEPREHKGKKEDILALLKRRPCTVEDIAFGMDIHFNEVIKHVQALSDRGLVSTKRFHGKTLYYISEHV